MQRKKCLRTLAAALIIAAAAVASSGAARASTYKVIHQFQLPKNPTGNLAIDAAGNLYGTTLYGGSCSIVDCGVAWKLGPNPDGVWTFSILHSFAAGADGANPQGGLVFDAATGNLYGTTVNFGASPGTGCCGTVFELKANPDGTWSHSVLYSFKGIPDGEAPEAGLTLDAAGNLYGTTSGGGAQGNGVVFKLAPNPDGTWTESVLYSFTGGTDGSNPEAGLIFDAHGNLYGTTSQGGPTSAVCGVGCGAVFKLARNADGTWAESVLHSFTGGADDGWGSHAGLIFDATGTLYGTTSAGGGTKCSGGGCGTVFKLARNPDDTWTESVLHSFTGGADGNSPQAGLIFDAAGNLYGTTNTGGDASPAACHVEAQGCGVVFKLTPTSGGWNETVLRSFRGLGKYPTASVIFDPKGNLYGTTSSGTGNYGVVFKITP
jgi:uncharacterized repeat protein (TIGR03803 family)